MIHTSIRCNGCGCEEPVVRAADNGQLQPHSVRTRLEKLGWRVGLPGGKDYCPDCPGAVTKDMLKAWDKLKEEDRNAPPRTIPFD